VIEMTLDQVADVVSGVVTGAGDRGRSITGDAFIDSRSVVPGGLFVALAGERVDGHDFAAGAVARGAAAFLGTRDCGVPGVLVADPVVALGLLARHVLDSLPGIKVLALTGSQGKTGTKDYLAQVLAGAGTTVATAGNFNNEIGVPLTVLRVDEETDFLVTEMGARGVGHIAHLCAIVPPLVAAVLNVGTAHVGEFGSRELIAAAKGEIVEALPAHGTAVLNAADPLTAAMAARTPARVLGFGPDAEVAAREVSTDDLGRPAFELGYAGRWAQVRLAQMGAHQVENAVAAAAMALAVGLDLDQVAHALTQARPASRWRMEPRLRSDGLLVINDAYNANPESMAAALETLGHIKRTRGVRTWAVLGEMLELGDGSAAAHRGIGRVVAAVQVDALVTVGTAAEQIAEAVRSDPAWRGEVFVTATRDEALATVRENVAAGDVVLVKASRGGALEHVADGLLVEGEADR
jgi:UDP-N-acetylmuramoyl-tripeptide--D-alanyl-D-alanine ligase